MGGDTSSDLTSILKDDQTHRRTEIHLVQSGGLIAQLPYDEASLKEKIKTLATEAQGGPRPIFMTLVPYTALQNWSFPTLSAPIDRRQKALRYYKRLVTVYYEYLNIRADQKRDSALAAQSAYFPGGSGLRTEDIDQVGDDVLDEMDAVVEYLKIADSPVCILAGANRKSLPKSPSKQAKKIDEEVKTQENDCAKKLKKAEKFDWDDYKFWVRLPIPMNAMTYTEQQILYDENADRRSLYQMLLYRHWVERLSDFRCRLLIECMRQKDRAYEMSLIVKTFPPLQ